VPGAGLLGWISIVTAREEKRAIELSSNRVVSDSSAKMRAALILRTSIEFAPRCGLLEPDAAGDNVRLEVVLALDRAASEAAEHR
jgi:hypothetical protein